MPVEPPVGGFAQFGGEVEVKVCRGGADMPQVGGQEGEFSLNVAAFGVPPPEGCHRETVPQIMKSWGTPPFIENRGAQTK